jgi:hypothetical protein
MSDHITRITDLIWLPGAHDGQLTRWTNLTAFALVATFAPVAWLAARALFAILAGWPWLAALAHGSKFTGWPAFAQWPWFAGWSAFARLA